MVAKTDDKPTGTLGVSSGTLGVSGSSGSKSSGLSVEVRKKRTFTANKGGSTAAVPKNDEEARRLEALEKAKQNSKKEEEARQKEKALAESLTHTREQDEKTRKQREQEELSLKEAEKKAREQAEKEKQEKEKEAEAERIKAAAMPVKEDTRKGSRKTLSVEDGKRKGKPSGKSGKKHGRNAYMEGLEQRYRTMGSFSRNKSKSRNSNQSEPNEVEKVFREVEIPEFITVQELASKMSEKSGDVVKQLMMMGQMVTLTETIDQETAALVVEELGHTYKLKSANEIEENLIEEDEDDSLLKERPPIVTVMGHVDHGKTSLLDALRNTDVTEGEAGGITQHIGAYQITTKSKKKITFLDTPGHEAFTAMRARGASVTDVVVLVVAADDSVMPQTIEAIDHAKAAGVPVVVAINKIDKPEANVDKVKQDLLSHDVIPEDYGGDIVCVPVSAKSGKGLHDLEDMILLQADILDLKANPNRQADGVVVESRLDKGRGPVASMIIQRGTLSVGDVVVAGCQWGRIRAMLNDKGANLEEAGPALPVEILGLQGVPEAGEAFVQVKDERQAREVAGHRSQIKREKEMAASRKKVSLEGFMSRIEDKDLKELNIIVKGDVQGSVEAIADSLNKLATEEVKVRAVHSAVGIITESDVMLAQTSEALVIGFNVRANTQARALAEKEGVEIRYYSVIYDLVNDIKAAMSGLLSPDLEEKVLGQLEIREIFKINKMKIAGCYVTEGLLRRNGKARVIRDGIVVHDGIIDTLRRFKDDVKEVTSGFECGLTLEKFDDLREGDIVECYEIEEIAKTIDDLKKLAEKVEESEEKTESSDDETASKEAS
jgi:translation initiation factor IF-2